MNDGTAGRGKPTPPANGDVLPGQSCDSPPPSSGYNGSRSGNPKAYRDEASKGNQRGAFRSTPDVPMPHEPGRPAWKKP